jgi:hypothetical protein
VASVHICAVNINFKANKKRRAFLALREASPVSQQNIALQPTPAHPLHFDTTAGLPLVDGDCTMVTGSAFTVTAQIDRLQVPATSHLITN